ncbi:hypothetical protein G1K37_11425 [Tenacibaculum dicentrarchi]|nr:hypothetical protein [Tenacibaculum dicentrarchi]
MKKIILFLSIITLIVGCDSLTSKLTIEELKADLIGTQIGRWKFDTPSEFIDVKIIDQNITGELNELNAEYILKGFNSGTLYYLRAKHVFKKSDDKWKLTNSYKMKFIKNYSKIKLE